MSNALTKYIERMRGIADQANVRVRSLEPDWDPETEPVANVHVEGAHATVRITGPITEWFGVDVNAITAALDQASPESISLYVNSPGGDYFDGLALYNDLRRRHEDGVALRAEIDGLAASAATLPFMAAEERAVREGSTMMIHRPWMMMITAGDADYIESETAKAVAGLRAADRGLAGVYAVRAGMEKDEAQALMEAETWMVGDEIVDKGFATQRLDGGAVEAEPSAESRSVVKALTRALLKRSLGVN